MTTGSAAQVLTRLHSTTQATDSGCQVWTASLNASGYAKTTWAGRYYLAHRLVYELTVGPIQPGMALDHLCHTHDPDCVGGPTCPHRACLNVAHLEVVTRRENSSRMYPARKTRCVNGHPYDEANTYVAPKGGSRSCRACGRQRVAQYKIRKQQRAAGIAA